MGGTSKARFHMNSFKVFTSLLFIFIILSTKSGFSQIDEEDEFERMLLEEVEVENPVYKPVVAFGVGTLNYLGDVTDFYSGMFGSQPGYKLNVSTFIDNRRNYRLNFFLLYGKLSGNERSFVNLERNLNFESEIINFGLNFEYTFNHFFRSDRRITPFISVGAESFQFNSKADLHNSQGIPYNYWSDGTIRSLPENSPDAHESIMIQRNYIYETDLRRANLYGMGDYPQISFAVPVDYGLDLKISERVNMRVGSSMHFAFTDLIDNLSSAGNKVKGRKRNDMFSYSYVTFHLDLFSDAKTIVVERLFLDVDFDYTLIEDEDNDGVFDFWDNCPNTPAGVAVDEFGCPIDSDGDGVPDFLDLEPNTRPGAFVDESGREITPDQLAIMLGRSSTAINRNEINLHTSATAYRQPGYSYQGYSGIPSKYRFLDRDGDGYISFEELIRAIDIFFDGESVLTVEDIYDLNNFFFSQ
jgi:hypothetical protein